MSESTSQLKIGAALDGSFETATSTAKRKIGELGAAASGTGKSLAGMGDGTAQSAQKVEQATKSMIQSIQRTTAVMDSGAKGSAEYYKALANQRGIDANVLKPYLDQLDAVKVRQAQASAAMLSGGQSLDKVAMSARATAAALRGVPAQFTDIVTSLQGGQAPLTVFLQQGGQLKDMFGGAGNAAKALGGYVVGLINPFTVAAAAAAAVGIAYMKGAAESEAYNKALILTGSAAGVTAGQLGKMAQAVSNATGGTIGAAAEALSQLAGSGNIATAQFERVAAVAVQMEKTTGVAVSETVKQFSELGKDPLDASIKLNETTRFLTLSVYEQIKALTEQGRTFEAGALAQKAYADAMNDRFPKLIENLGLVESAWAKVGGVAKKAWDQFLGIGRTADPVKEVAAALKSAQDRLAMLTGQAKSAQGYDRIGANSDVASQEAVVSNLKKQADYNASIESSKGRTAAYMARQAESTQAQIAFDKESDKYLSKAVQMQQAIAAAQERFTRVSQTPSNLAKYTTEIEGIQKKFEEAAKKAPAVKAIKFDDFDKSVILEYAKSMAALEAIQLKAAASTEGLSKTQASLRDVQASPQWAKFNRQMQEQVIYTASLAQGKEDEAEATKALARAQEDLNKSRNAALLSYGKELESLGEKAQKLEDEVSMYGLSKEAIEALTTARMLDQIEVLKGFDNSAEEIVRIEAVISARKRLATAGTAKDMMDENAKAAKEATAEWKRTADSINNTLTDALMRAFEGGKGFARAMRDTIVNMFKTMVLRPVISAIMSPVSAAIGGTLGMSGAAQAAGTGSNLLSGASAIAGGASAFGGSFAAGAALGTEAFGAGVTMMTSATGMTSFMAGAGQALGAIGPVGWAALAALAIVAISSGGETRNGAKYGVGSDGKAVKLEGPSGGEIASTQVRGLFDLAKSSIEGMLTGLGSKAVLTGYTAALESSENGKGFAYATGQINGKAFGDTNTFNNMRGDKTAEQAIKDYQLNLSQSILEALQVTSDIPATVAKLIKDGLNGSEVKDLSQEAVNAILGTVSKLSGEVNTFSAAMTQLPFEALKNLSFDTAAGLIAAAGGFEKLDASLSGFYKNFYSAEEQRANLTTNTSKAFADLGLTMPTLDAGARAAYRSMVELAAGQDLSVEANAKAYASLLALQGPMNELAPAFDAVGDLFTDLIKDIKTAIDSIAGERVSVAAAALQINSPGVMSRDAIQRAIAGTALATPGNAGLSAAQQALGRADANVAANAADLASAKSTAPSIEALNLARAALDSFVAMGRDAFTTATPIVYYDEGGYTTGSVSSFDQAGYDSALGAKANAQSSYDSQLSSYTGAASASASQIAKAQAQLTAATTAQSAAVTAARAAQTAYIASLQDFSIDATKASAKLGKLREETMRYYDAQKQLSDLMTNSAENLRGAVSAARSGQLDPAQSLSQQQGVFASAYSMALSTTGATQAGYADKLTAALPGLSAALMDTASTREGWAAATGTLFAQSEAIAQQLEANSPKDYAADSLSMLGQIDAALNVLDASSKSAEKVIADAVTAGSENTANGLRAVVAALTGQSIPAFAAGGSFGGGLRIVGENGPELEATGPSRIFNAAQTRAMMSGGGNEEMIQELRALRQEVAGLRAEAQATAGHTSKTARLLDRAMPDGDALATRATA